LTIPERTLHELDGDVAFDFEAVGVVKNMAAGIIECSGGIHPDGKGSETGYGKERRCIA
jgi:hypothetical protein